MKVKLFAIGAAMVALMFAACNQPVEIDGDVSLAANRPGAPSDVKLTTANSSEKDFWPSTPPTATESVVRSGPAGVMLEWTIGENASSHQIFVRLNEDSPIISASSLGLFQGNSSGDLGTAAWVDYVADDPNTAIDEERIANYARNSTLNPAKRHVTGIDTLVAFGETSAWKRETYQVGVRASYPVTSNGNNSAPSEIVWATNDDGTFATVTIRENW